jgi:hypothetical protein
MPAAVVQPGMISACHADDPGSNPGGRTKPKKRSLPAQPVDKYFYKMINNEVNHRNLDYLIL